jgi:thymidine kinase
MFSGKSTELRREGCRKLAVLVDKSKVLLINSQKDSRFGDESVIKTHDGVHICAKKVSFLSELTNTDVYEKAEAILIDEAQFFDDLYDFVVQACNVHGKQVIIAGLDGDYLRKPFGNGDILKLIPQANHIKKLSALCMICADGKTAAPFTARICAATEQTVVGAGDKYISVCRRHHGI